MTKILFLHNTAEISGGERSLLNLFEHLDRDRFEPILLLPETGIFSRAAERLQVKVCLLEVPKFSPFSLLQMITCVSRLEKIVKETGIHLIHSYTPRNNLMGWLVAQKMKIPILWHERNLVMPGEHDVTRTFLGLPDRIICNSLAVAGRFAKKGKLPSKIRVVVNGVNLDTFKSVQDLAEYKRQIGCEGQLTVGMVTNLNKRKNVEFFLEIAALVLKQVPGVKFFVIGGEFPDAHGKRFEELKDLVRKLGLEDHVLFTGYQDDVRKYLFALDVFLHVTVKEACSRAILEAMAAGKSVVAVDDGGNPELVEHGITGILVAAGAREGFVQAVGSLLSHESVRQAMGQKGRRRAEELFDVKCNAGEIEKAYEDVLA